jgi:hypothetical protein
MAAQHVELILTDFWIMTSLKISHILFGRWNNRIGDANWSKPVVVHDDNHILDYNMQGPHCGESST